MSMHPLVRIHIARLDAFDQSVGTDWLTTEEATRLQAMSASQRRQSFLAGHWLARRAAGEWLDVEPRQVAVHHHADGRPYLHVGATSGNNIIDIMRSSGMAQPPEPVLALSISHSGNWLAVAVTTLPVGIDLELPRRIRNFDALARFAFSPAEASHIASVDESERAAAFHRIWTLKEARGKRIGEGFLPEQSRKLTTTTTSADRAEAIAWAFEGGSLALAIDPGTQIEFANAPEPAERSYWRFE